MKLMFKTKAILVVAFFNALLVSAVVNAAPPIPLPAKQKRKHVLLAIVRTASLSHQIFRI